jgi:uncharacterized membrane protein YdjX (TVP38/TMEM64 family)
MKEHVVELLQNYKPYAFFISILISVVISIAGFIPSLFLTAANLVVFGFWKGTALSFIGEGVGAIVSFLIYRKGFRKISETKIFHNRKMIRLLEVKGKQAFTLVFSLRLMPFVPSGVVTFLAAMGKMSIVIFAVSSTIGKLPALLFEAYSANQMIQWTWQGKMIIMIFAGILFISVLRSLYLKNKSSK